MLLLDAPRRLSIDVDILCLEPLDKLQSVLERISREPPFHNWEYQERRDREAPPTKHFQVYFNSSVGNDPNPKIQIDVINSESPYAKVEQKSLARDFIVLNEDITVPIPSASSLLGDKLASFSPSTIGYPYEPITRSGDPGEPRPIKVIKHLFDLGELASIADDFVETIETYRKILPEQNLIRETDFTIDECLDDTQDAAFWVSRIGGRKLPPEPKLDFLAKGIRALDNHLLTQNFRNSEARSAAAKSALIAEAIRQDAKGFSISKYLAAELDMAHLAAANLEDSWSDLNSLKKTDTSSFACWEMAQQLRKGLHHHL